MIRAGLLGAGEGVMGNEQVAAKFGRGNFYRTPLYFLGFELWESIINLKIRLKNLK